MAYISNVHYFALSIETVQYSRAFIAVCTHSRSVTYPHHPLGAADNHPLHRRRLRAERRPKREAAGGVLPRLRLRYH